MTKQKFWGYKHINGTLHLKSYSGNFAKDAVEDAYDSDFIEDVLDPFEAANREEAGKKLREHFSA